MIKKLILLQLFVSCSLFAQVSANGQQTILNFIAAKEFSKDIALHAAKYFAVNEIIGTSNEIVEFDIDPLAASNSGEITSLAYRCKEKNLEGLVLGFFNESWNKAGVIYSGYGFKDLPKQKAQELLNKIQDSIDDYWEYMGGDYDVNNITFKYDDILVIIYRNNSGAIIRLFWNGFDSEWNSIAMKRTQKRLTKKLN